MSESDDRRMAFSALALLCRSSGRQSLYMRTARACSRAGEDNFRSSLLMRLHTSVLGQLRRRSGPGPLNKFN